uniref:Uncharacterized protein n=1 Tax=Acrobeloides nanus TaxID=290746 RepID=A0A914EML5_9BILA
MPRTEFRPKDRQRPAASRPNMNVISFKENDAHADVALLRAWHNLFYNNNVDDWKQYDRMRYNCHAIVPAYRRSCFVGWKKNVCEHSMIAGIRDGVMNLPDNFVHRLLEQSRCRGRPKKPAPAFFEIKIYVQYLLFLNMNAFKF